MRDRASPLLCLRCGSAGRTVDDAAGDVGVLVEEVAGTDPVVAVGDREWPTGSDVAADQQDR